MGTYLHGLGLNIGHFGFGVGVFSGDESGKRCLVEARMRTVGICRGAGREKGSRGPPASAPTTTTTKATPSALRATAYAMAGPRRPARAARKLAGEK